MPLPDERPRQSVANLIGRFEQKRQSLTAIPPPLPRSTSVASHITGDSVKEEIKEKREWPPKSTGQEEKPKISFSPSTTWRPSPSQTTPLLVIEAAAPSAKPAAKDPVPLPPPSPPASEPVKTPKSSSSTAKSPPVRKPTSTPVKTPTPKASTTKKSPVRITSSVSQPLRPQHTGASTTRAATTTPSTVRHIKSNSNSTPNRPKTPASSHMSRPKTPGSALSTGAARPKTPSAGSGLFAPTAASLAKARNAVPAVPTPIKKATLSSDAAERLSKPTAASISKVRKPSLPETSPSGGGKVAARRGGTMKMRVGLAPARMKEMAAKKNGNGVKVAEAAAAVGGETSGDQEVAQHSDEGENGHDLDASGFLAESETAEDTVESYLTESEDVSHEVVDEGISHDGSLEEHANAEDESELSITVSHETSSSPLPEESSHELEHDPEADAPAETQHDSDESGTPQPALVKEHHVPEVKHHVQGGTDIQDIVNLLESIPTISVPTTRPLSMDGILDNAPDIPDEE